MLPGASDRVRVVAVDWSGAARGAERRIWLAEAHDGAVVRLEGGRDRDAVAAHLIDLAHETPRLVVGLDFAFSMPQWFLDELGVADAPALWVRAARDGERWLAECRPPFWGRPGTRRPEPQEHLRRTEREVLPNGNVRPKAVFQIGGAGAVGTGSIRGMRLLGRLRDAGFAVWPFDPPRLPVVLEIYPRALTGAVVKSRADARSAYLDARYPTLPADVRASAAGSEDAFDALVSALVMDAHAEALLALPPARDAIDAREGRIWAPA